jgi:hypothetical protein
MIKPVYNFTIRSKSMIIASVATTLGISGVALPVIAHAMGNEHVMNHSTMAMQRYVAAIHELNNTGVSGTATFTTSGNELTVSIEASGLQPGVHPIHIHGKDVAKAECPTNAQDANGDGYLSVIEGAPAYGLIKLNLTNPQTAFGTPPTPALFYPFAGTPNNANFPTVAADGLLHFKSTYMFDGSADAQAALKSLTPLGNQAIVIHGATAPKSVDAPALAALGKPYAAATDLTASVYDALLPAGCGLIDQATTSSEQSDEMDTTNMDTSTMNTGTQSMNDNNQQSGSVSSMGVDMLQQHLVSGLTVASANATDASVFNSQVTQLSSNFSTTVQKAVSTYQASVSQGSNHDVARNELINTLASAKDQELNGLTESRNQLIDKLNQSGNVTNRDAFLNGFNTAVDQYRDKIEQVKNQL